MDMGRTNRCDVGHVKAAGSLLELHLALDVVREQVMHHLIVDLHYAARYREGGVRAAVLLD